MDAEDEHRGETEGDDRAHLPGEGAPTEGGAENAQHEHLREVEQECYRRATRLEQAIGHPAAEEAAEDAAEHEGDTRPPVQRRLFVKVVDLGEVFGEVEHHALAHEPGAKLGADEGDDDRVSEDPGG